MSQLKATTGPWEWVEDRFRDGYCGLFSGDEPVLCPQSANDGDTGAAWFGIDQDYYGETALTEADAALIAAAPELYALLDKLSPMLTDINAHAVAKEVEALLAKARGES